VSSKAATVRLAPMVVLPYPDEDRARFLELAELYLRCRDAFRDMAAENRTAVGPGSTAEQDRTALLTRQPPVAATSERLISRIANVYLYAASEHLGGLLATYARVEVLLAPLVLARCAIEHSAHTIWLLGNKATTPEERLARAFLEAIVGAEQAKMQAGRLTGRRGETHVGRTGFYKAVREDAETTFGAPPHDDKGWPLVNGQHMLTPEEIVVEMNRLSSQPLSDDEIRGTYGYLSNFVHPTYYARQELFYFREQDGKRVPELDRDIEFHNKLARLTVVPFYHALFHTASYHGWNRARLLQLNDDIYQLLPGVFVAGPKPGPFDPTAN
jgi:hypothetical protein